MSFNFSVQSKNSKNLSQSTDKKISSSLKSKENYYKISEILKTGGSISIKLENANVEREIKVADNFLQSIKIPQQKFTNFIDVKNVSETTKETFKLILEDIEFICNNNEMIDFSKKGSELTTLRAVLKKYDYKEALTETNETIFKLDGVSIMSNGIKENPFRIYLQMTRSKDFKKSTYRLLFCDIYHLCLPSWHNGKAPNIVKAETFSKYNYTCKDHLRVLLDKPL